jgi:hypothetical protein
MSDHFNSTFLLQRAFLSQEVIRVHSPLLAMHALFEITASPDSVVKQEEAPSATIALGNHPGPQ